MGMGILYSVLSTEVMTHIFLVNHELEVALLVIDASSGLQGGRDAVDVP